MAYERKTTNEEELGLEPIFKIIRQILSKWWLVVIFIMIFSISGFGVAKITYDEQYNSTLIFNVSNKDRDIVGAAATYTTASDAQASTTIATNFKTLIQRGNDFITMFSLMLRLQPARNMIKSSCAE